MKLKKTIIVRDNTNNKDMAHKMIDDLPNGDYHIIIVNRDSIRSTHQNDFLWGTIYPAIADKTGYSCDNLHDILRYQFLRNSEDKLISTSALTKTEFTEYVNKVMNWAASIGVTYEEA